MENSEEKELTPSQKLFCHEYIFDWNGARAYKIAYPGVKDETARANASRLLTYANVQAYCKELCENDERYTGISRRMIILEHKKIATSSIAHLHNTWIQRKEFENLTDEQRACIAEIQTQTRMERNPIEGGEAIQVDFVKIKLYDKQKSLDSISKLLGFNAAEKLDVKVEDNVKSFVIEPASGKEVKGK